MQDIVKKGGAKSPLTKILGNSPELNGLSTNKNIWRLLNQAICHLATPNHQPSYPASKIEIQEDFDVFFVLKTQVIQLLLAGFILQGLIGIQMSRALTNVEQVVDQQVRAWQDLQKEG